MVKWNFYVSNTSLIKELDTSGNDVNPQSQSFLAPTLDLQGDKIVFKDNGSYKTAIMFPEIGEIDGVNPSDLQDAYDKIIAIIPNSGGGGGSETLQQVTDNGNTTTKDIILVDNSNNKLIELKSEFQGFQTSSILSFFTSLSSFAKLRIRGNGDITTNNFNLYNGDDVDNNIGVTNVNTNSVGTNNVSFPNTSGTIALTSDIPTVDATPTDGSSNAVSSNGVFDALVLKQDALTETNFGSFINGLTAKNTLVDADEVVSDDSADSNKAKKTSWLNVWTNYLKVKADTLYQAVLVSGTNIKTINGSSVLGSGNLTLTASIPFDVVFPESYGAVGDGTTDDTTAIQNAIDSGFPVWLSAKTYKVTTLTVTSNRTLIGEGYNSVLYTTSNAAIINITGDYNNLRQFRLKGNSTGTSQNGVQAIGVVGLTSYRILNVLNNLYGDSLGGSMVYSQYMVGTSSGANHEGSFVGSNLIGVNCNIGIFCDTRGEYNQFYNCSFSGCTKGVHIVAGNITIQGGKMVDNTYGVYLTTGTNDAHGLISGCLINHNTTNVYSNGIVNGMIFSNCALFAGNLEILTSDGIYFNGCFFGGTVQITSTNSTDLNFNNCRYFINPTLVITGNNPYFNNCRFASANTLFNSGGDAINYASTSTVSGWSGSPTKLIQIVMNGRSAQIFFDINGTATTGSKTMTLPFTNVTISKVVNIYLNIGGTATTNGGAAQINAGASTVTFFTDMALGALPTSGTLRVIGMIEIQVAN